MYFNRTLDNANEIFFNLNVWNDNNGEPGEIIYSENSLKPLWENGLYEFYPYMFADTTIIVFLKPTFFKIVAKFFTPFASFTDAPPNLNICIIFLIYSFLCLARLSAQYPNHV